METKFKNNIRVLNKNCLKILTRKKIRANQGKVEHQWSIE
jgi:hypothetical protein